LPEQDGLHIHDLIGYDEGGIGNLCCGIANQNTSILLFVIKFLGMIPDSMRPPWDNTTSGIWQMAGWAEPKLTSRWVHSDE
jgi:hypothetical protein